jgi:glucokinase
LLQETDWEKPDISLTGKLRPFATEGGHSEFSPRTNVEVEFYQFLNNIYGIVSWENVLSKSGLFNIYRFLRCEKTS